jgi:hypothetical protein
VPDENAPATWRLPIFVPGNSAQTRNFVKTALARFAEAKQIPESERQILWTMLVGAAKCHGLQVQKQAPAMAKAVRLPDAYDVEMKSVLAEGELAAERLLKQLGY